MENLGRRKEQSRLHPRAQMRCCPLPWGRHLSARRDLENEGTGASSSSMARRDLASFSTMRRQSSAATKFSCITRPLRLFRLDLKDFGLSPRANWSSIPSRMERRAGRRKTSLVPTEHLVSERPATVRLRILLIRLGDRQRRRAAEGEAQVGVEGADHREAYLLLRPLEVGIFRTSTTEGTQPPCTTPRWAPSLHLVNPRTRPSNSPPVSLSQ